MKGCDHKFVDSKHCLKCGWVPPSMTPSPRSEAERVRLSDEECETILDEAIACEACMEADVTDPIFVGVCRHEWNAAFRAAFAEGASRQRRRDAERLQAIVSSLDMVCGSRQLPRKLYDGLAAVRDDLRGIARSIERASAESTVAAEGGKHRPGCNGRPCLASCMCHCHDEEGMADAE